MGDVRFESAYRLVAEAKDRVAALRALDDEGVVAALAAASRRQEPFLANVIATEALNRVDRLRAALANLGEGVLTLSPEGTILWANPAAERILRLERERLLGAAFHEVVVHEDEEGRRLPASLVERALASEMAQGDGERFRVRGGPDICVAYTAAPIRGRDDSPNGVVLAFQDCGERKAAERRLRESNERYRSLFVNAPEAYVSVDLDGRIVDTNPADQRLTGRSADESRGRRFTEFLHPDDVDRARLLFRKIVAGHPETAPLRVRHKDGHHVRVEARGIPIVVDGEVTGVHGMLRPA